MSKFVLPIVAVMINFSLLAHASDKNHARELAVAQAQQAQTVQVAEAR
jgi:hypothetical protein